jgi:hypothetical protein
VTQLLGYSTQHVISNHALFKNSIVQTSRPYIQVIVEKDSEIKSQKKFHLHMGRFASFDSMQCTILWNFIPMSKPVTLFDTLCHFLDKCFQKY